MDVSIRKWTMEDAPALASAISNQKVQDNLRDGLPLPYTLENAQEFIGFMLSDAHKDHYFAVVADGRVVGNIGIHGKDNVHRRTAEIGYYLAEEAWGKGVMSEAVRQACEKVFAQTDILRIYADPYTRNKASCRVLEKAGFVHEGTLRANAIKNGVVEDMEMYALVRL